MDGLFIDKRQYRPGYWLMRGILLLLLVITFMPFIMMIIMSLKSNIMNTTDFWALPKQIEWVNYSDSFLLLVRPIMNSLFIGLISIAGVIILTALSGYSFARFRFFGKEIIFLLFIGVMMIPNLLMMVPQYLTICKFNLLNNYMALIFPYMAGLQLFGIMLARSYFQTLPEDMFESAKIEGAGDFYMFTRIALPLSWPILVTVGIQSLIAVYNDFVWPQLIISGASRRTFAQSVVLLSVNGGSDYGMLTAGYVIGAIPLVIITMSCLKYYLKGLLDGALKG